MQRGADKQINQPSVVQAPQRQMGLTSPIPRALKWSTRTTLVFQTTAQVLSGTCSTLLLKVQMPHQAAEGARGEEQKRCLEVERVAIPMFLRDFLSPLKFHPTALELID